MKKILLIAYIILQVKVHAQTLYFPPNGNNSWDTISSQSLGWCQLKIDTLLNFLESKNTKAFILLKEGKIVIEKYFGTFTQDSMWVWNSAGKTLTAFTVGIAQQENLLSLSDTVSDYLGTGWTSAASAQEEKITICNQLTMTSGLDDGVADPYCTNDTCLLYLADAGTRWAYHNAPYTLLDGVISAATGQTLNAYVTAKVLAPAGMQGLFWPVGFNNIFISKARSMARFGLLLLAKGKWNATPVLADTVYFNEMVNSSQSLNLSYGYLTWLNGKSSFMLPGLQFVFPGQILNDAPADMYAAVGKDGQIINVVPSQNLVFIRMGETPGVGGAVPVTFNNELWQKINDLPCISSVESYLENRSFSIFPNPANDVIIINSKREIGEIKIFDVAGRLIRYELIKNTNAEIDIKDFNAGIYFIEIGSKRVKFVKM